MTMMKILPENNKLPSILNKSILFFFFSLWSCSAIFAQSLDIVKLGELSYPQWDLNDVWGYADSSGNEYALVGVNDRFNVVDVTNPATPVSKINVYGAYSVWRDIKTWSHYAYVCHDFQFGWSTSPDEGITIVDLDSLQSARYKRFKPKFSGTNDSLRTAHNLWIDENGVLYVFGSNLFSGGVLMFDVATDPWNPTYLGKWETYYLHDGFARNDTLYGAAVNQGVLTVIDVTLKSAPQLLATKSTPNQFTHNCWLSDDGKTVFTTDELPGAYIAAYDVSDLSNITELDKIRTLPNTGVIPHNVHVYGNFLVTSYYTSGLNIVDATYPDLLVETGFYDTSPNSGGGYTGAWGAYPYLPSGHILVTDMQTGLFVLSSDYTPAARLHGTVIDSLTGNPILGADVAFTINSFMGTTGVDGTFKVGSAIGGTDAILVSRTGYFPKVVNMQFNQGVYDSLTIALLPIDFGTDEQLSTSPTTVYPNPSHGNFSLQFKETVWGQNTSVTLFTLTGEVVYKTSFLAQTEHDFSLNLPEGIYMIVVQTDSASSTHKLLITD